MKLSDRALGLMHNLGNYFQDDELEDQFFKDGFLDAWDSTWAYVTQLEAENEIFPMQDGPPITRKTAEMIYEMYSNLFGSSQSLDRLAERGGFGWAEVKLMTDTFIRKRGLKTFNQLKKRWL